MGKRKNKSKRSTTKLPKGLPTRGESLDVNPFEVTHRQKRPKFHVHNRMKDVSLQSIKNSGAKKTSALAIALKERKREIKESSKSNVFADQRIGIRNNQLSQEDQTLARLVRERTRQSKRASQFHLGDDEAVVTHRGQVIGEGHFDPSHVVLEEKEEGTDLDEVETSLHFGGGDAKVDSYGRSDLTTQYLSRKTELDEMIMRRKVQKAEKQKTKGDQVDAFAEMDGKFKELSKLLSFRDKEKAEIEHMTAKREKRLTDDDQEMADWDKEMKEFMLTTDKVKATDRTKTTEEIAKDEADRLHELETRRLARMQGEFDNDDLSDVDDGDHPETLDAVSDNEDEPEPEPAVRFTADGLVRVDANGTVLGSAFEDQKAESPVKKSTVKNSQRKLHLVGTKVMASYLASEQTDGNHSWFSGKILKVNPSSESYDVEYDDGDVETGVLHEHISVMETPSDNEKSKRRTQQDEERELKKKRLKAKVKASNEIPFVFDVPTTLEGLNELIGTYASCGREASLIIERIYKANSVRLNHQNKEKMQNFYDILLRRFIAIGDAIHENGDGVVVERCSQLDAITCVLYDMAHDAPEGASATWSRRLGFIHSAHMKRLRDASYEQADGFSAWPSTGTFLALRLISQIFPVTDKRHCITTPSVLFLGQVLTHTPILSKRDLMMGTLCCGLLLEYTKGAKRLAPESHAFLSGSLRLFAKNKNGPLPTLNDAVDTLKEELGSVNFSEDKLKLSLERSHADGPHAMGSILYSSLVLIESSIDNLTGFISGSEPEVFSDLAESIIALKPQRFPDLVRDKVSSIVSKLQLSVEREPLRRQGTPKKQLKTLAPRIENTTVGRKNNSSESDRLRRELKREHKSVVRDIRLDAGVVESERRRSKSEQQDAARTKRHKAYAWMEQEQATINNQVREGGGLLHGGGMGAAKIKASSAKLGMKKGGKLRR